MTCRAICDNLFDYLIMPSIERWEIELVELKKKVKLDWRFISETKSIIRRKPEKGIARTPPPVTA